MPTQKSQTRKDIASALIRKFPKHGARTLARALNKDNPQLFPTIESARRLVRELTGQNGAASRKAAPLKREARPPGYKLELPDSRAKNRSAFKITGKNKILVISDLHLPYHNAKAVEIALTHGQAEECDTILILGDLMDCYQLSRWVRDPAQCSIAQEIEVGKAFFAYLRERFPKARIIWKEGNHEERWLHFFFNNAPQLAALETMSLYHALGVKEFGVEIVDDKRSLDISGLLLYHGHELPTGLAPAVNPARGLFLRLFENAMCGHFHRSSHHVEKSAKNDLVSCWSIGCLCDLSPDFATINKWNNGFAIIEQTGPKSFGVDNYMIHDGQLMGGKNAN